MKRESKTTILTILGLVLLSVGLWSYQTFVVPKQEAELYTSVYVASADIPTDAVIKEEMLGTVRVNEDSIVPGAITNSNEIVGKRAIAGILEGELIQENRLSDLLIDQGDLFVRVEPDFHVDIYDGDHVRVFVQEPSGSLELLFERKEVYSVQRVTNLLDGESAAGFYLLLDEQEVENYYQAKQNGAVILTRIKPEATDEDVAASTGEPIVFESNDTDEGPVNVESNNRYTVQQGQTIEDVAADIDSDVNTIRGLNDGIEDVNAGDILVIP